MRAGRMADPHPIRGRFLQDPDKSLSDPRQTARPCSSHPEDAGRARLLQYVHEGAPGDDRLTERIDAAVARTNEDAAWRESAMGFMTVEYSHRCDLDGARKEGLQAGLQEGLQQGQAQANARYSALVDALLDAGRADDLKRAANDPAFRERLFQESHIA